MSSAMQDLHAGLAAAVQQRGGGNSTLRNGVSKHCLPHTIAFGALGRLHELVREAVPEAVTFLGTVGEELILSVREAVPNGKSKKKRRREEQVDIEPSLDRLKGIAPSAEIDRIRVLLQRIYGEIRGSHDEPAVQTTLVEWTKLQSSDTAPRAVVAVRLHASVPVPLHRVRSALADIWADGAVTTRPSISTMACSLPPLSAEGRVALEGGSVSWCFLTSIPVLSAETQ